MVQLTLTVCVYIPPKCIIFPIICREIRLHQRSHICSPSWKCPATELWGCGLPATLPHSRLPFLPGIARAPHSVPLQKDAWNPCWGLVVAFNTTVFSKVRFKEAWPFYELGQTHTPLRSPVEGPSQACVSDSILKFSCKHSINHSFPHVRPWHLQMLPFTLLRGSPSGLPSYGGAVRTPQVPLAIKTGKGDTPQFTFSCKWLIFRVPRLRSARYVKLKCTLQGASQNIAVGMMWGKLSLMKYRI